MLETHVVCLYCVVDFLVYCLKFSLPPKGIPVGSPSRGGDVMVYAFDIKLTELAHSFYPVLVSISVFTALSAVFHSINSPNNSPFFFTLFFWSYLCLTDSFSYISLYESLLQP